MAAPCLVPTYKEGSLVPEDRLACTCGRRGYRGTNGAFAGHEATWCNANVTLGYQTHWGSLWSLSDPIYTMGLSGLLDLPAPSCLMQWLGCFRPTSFISGSSPPVPNPSFRKLADCAQLLEVDDMVRLAVPDSKCVYTYIQELYRSLVQKGLVKTKKK